jgi:hypothetical protein
MLRLPINKTLTLMILTVLMIGGLFAAAPLWGPFLTSEEMALATLPMIGVAIAAPAFAGLCLLVRCQRCRYRLFWYAVTASNGFSRRINARRAAIPPSSSDS